MSLRSMTTTLAVLGTCAVATAQTPEPTPAGVLTNQYILPTVAGVPLPAGPQLYPQMPPVQAGYWAGGPEGPNAMGYSDPWDTPTGIPRQPRRRLADGSDPTTPRASVEMEYLLFRLKPLTGKSPLVTTGPASSFGLPGSDGVRSLGS
ncbi:MAG: hypothetical protein ACRCZF_09045, partial [Gemmataceae bacterium]